MLTMAAGIRAENPNDAFSMCQNNEVCLSYILPGLPVTVTVLLVSFYILSCSVSGLSCPEMLLTLQPKT